MHRQAFAMTNNMDLSGQRENAIFTKIILITNDTNGCVKGDIWCQRGFCGKVGSRSISKETTPSRTTRLPPRTGKVSHEKVG